MVHLELQIRELNARISAPPWMSEICTALGWQGGTWTQVIAEVTRLVEVAAESRRQIKSLMGTMGADA